MKFYSDTLTTADFRSALPGPGFYLARLDTLENPRIRTRGWNVLIGRFNSRRYFNSGTHGACGVGAATHDEWGEFIAALYEKDPDMRAGYYRSKGHFHATTGNRYVPWSPLVRRT